MSIKGLVEQVLRGNPDTRNSDKKLYLEVIKRMGIEFKEENIDRLPEFESIIRRRAEFNQQGKYLPTDPEVIFKRQLYNVLCPAEILQKEDYPAEVISAVCRRCKRVRTENCHAISGATAAFMPRGMGEVHG